MRIYKQDAKAFFCTMFNIGWSAFRHPFKTTLIDWETGKTIGHYSQEELHTQDKNSEDQNPEKTT
ncbi:MAG: hypothetical protein HY094_06325 [Candidatus Melainabacteria bacterium]|nr:hypothetical protein [Candidatus Melainabacteria bacterium]